MLKLEDLQAFVEVVETGGFGSAGRRLGLSKSMVSRRVSRLEAELGARLLSRTTRGVAATEAGLEFKARAEKVLADLADARQGLAQAEGEIVGALRVAVPLSFGVSHLGPVLAELALRHPRLQVQTAYSDRFVDLIGERYDAAIRLTTLEDSSLIARKIAPILGAVVASPDYIARRGAPQTPDELPAHDTVNQGDMVWRFRGPGDRLFTVRPDSRFKADNAHGMMAAAVAGLGVTLLPTFLAGPEIEKGSLVRVLDDYRLPEAGLYVVRPPPREPAPAAVRALTELLLEKFGGEPYWDLCALHQARLAPAG
jgi:DNA-binding transcriptional LysR family regulator